MSNLLYKVSHPSQGETFEPRPFWRTDDWAFSDDHPHDGLVEDCVLFVAEFDEVNIHLLPKVWRLRVWLDSPERASRLRSRGYQWKPDARAVLFVSESDKAEVERFAPTVFAFDTAGFERTPTNEFISRVARTAVSKETIPIREALARWHVEVIYVLDVGEVEAQCRQGGIDHQIQT